jgi:hypothetical protein
MDLDFAASDISKELHDTILKYSTELDDLDAAKTSTTVGVLLSVETRTYPGPDKASGYIGGEEYFFVIVPGKDVLEVEGLLWDFLDENCDDISNIHSYFMRAM